jgi:GntR family transcriptional regulator
MVQSDNSTPLYQVIVDDIVDGIQDGTYEAGDQLPSEAQMCKSYGMSRTTVRKAMQVLADSGYLSKDQGRRSRINSQKLERKIQQTAEVLGFDELCAASGRKAGAKVLACEPVMRHPAEAELLGLPDSSPLLLIQRLRTADGVSVMLENSFFPLGDYLFLVDEDLNDSSIFNAVEQKLGKRPAGHSKFRLDAVPADKHTAETLRVPRGEPLFLETLLLVDEKGDPMMVAENYIVGKLYSFEM